MTTKNDGLEKYRCQKCEEIGTQSEVDEDHCMSCDEDGTFPGEDALADDAAIPQAVRSELIETIEDIGQAMGLLREASDDARGGNIQGGKMCGSDALEILSRLECKFSEMTAKLAAWSECENNERAGSAQLPAAPIRVTLSRRKGWRMPINTVKVDRSTKWGNPFEVGKNGTRSVCVEMLAILLSRGTYLIEKPSMDAQNDYRALVKNHITELRGKNLACWCPQGAACHADILLNLANTSVSGPCPPSLDSENKNQLSGG